MNRRISCYSLLALLSLPIISPAQSPCFYVNNHAGIDLNYNIEQPDATNMMHDDQQQTSGSVSRMGLLTLCTDATSTQSSADATYIALEQYSKPLHQIGMHLVVTPIPPTHTQFKAKLVDWTADDQVEHCKIQGYPYGAEATIDANSSITIKCQQRKFKW